MSPWYSPRSSKPVAPPMPNPERRCSSQSMARPRASPVGCLEGDLREHARAVAASESSATTCAPRTVLFGLGAGCEGADVLLARLPPRSTARPMAALSRLPGNTRVRGRNSIRAPLGTASPVNGHPGSAPAASKCSHAVREPLLPHSVAAGRRTDARPWPACRILGWRITVVEHRAAYLRPNASRHRRNWWRYPRRCAAVARGFSAASS